jgi:hypothetical protein
MKAHFAITSKASLGETLARRHEQKLQRSGATDHHLGSWRPFVHGGCHAVGVNVGGEPSGAAPSVQQFGGLRMREQEWRLSPCRECRAEVSSTFNVCSCHDDLQPQIDHNPLIFWLVAKAQIRGERERCLVAGFTQLFFFF